MSFYCPQWEHKSKGWIDLPSLASESERTANVAAKLFSRQFNCKTQVVQKPEKWNPPASGNEEVPAYGGVNSTTRSYNRNPDEEGFAVRPKLIL